MKHWHALRNWVQVVEVAIVLAGLAVAIGTAPASARMMINDDDGGGGGGDGGGDGGSPLDCLGETTASFWASPAQVQVGEYTTLHWSVSPAPGCTGMTQSISADIGPVPRTGSRTVRIISPRSWGLFGQLLGGRRELASAAVTVQLPPTVTITSDNQVGLFLYALTQPGTRIEIHNHVTLNLSHEDYRYIAPGVKILGGRSSTDPGPLLFTTTFPERLFLIGSSYQGNEADEVRVSGIRLQGAQMGIADNPSPESVGITVYSSQNVEIDNNELYGWSNAAVSVEDPFDRINPDNYTTVWVHDNFIHHNQHRARLGYGVVLSETAYALIERNVFDWNRHAIAGDGSDGSGYRAYRNLVLKNGGYHDTYNACDIPWWLALFSQTATIAKALCVLGVGPSYTHYTHQFDMHGQDNCGISGTFSDTVFNCGTAGHDMDIRHNTFIYTKGNGIKLRGTPQVELGASVISNVFAHDDLEDAVTQTETGLFLSGNRLGINGMNALSVGVCDFNGDGVNDDFLATGATWWYRSGALGAESAWRYLYTSSKLRHQLTLGYFSGDSICDVKDDTGLVYLGGVTPDPSLPRLPNVKELRLADASAVLAAAGFTTGTVDTLYDANCTYISGTVASQRPAAGTYVPLGTPVNLSLAQRPIGGGCK